MEERDDEATQLILEAFFDIRGLVFDIQRAPFGEGDEEAEEDP